VKRTNLMGVVLSSALLAPAVGFAQISCSREGLQHAVDLYIAAQAKGDTSDLPLANGLGYMENAATADITDGLIKKPMKIDHHRSLLDTATCQTYTEVIVTDQEHPYVFGTRLRVNHDKIAEIEIIWTTTPMPISMRFSKGRKTSCRGVTHASARKAACTSAKARPMTAATSVSRAA
jgi:hypothetical protein